MPTFTREICDNGIEDNANSMIDCADPECAIACGTLTIPWTVQLNGTASTCQALDADLVEIAADGALDYSVTPVCSAGQTAITVPAGSYDISYELGRNGFEETLATAGPVSATAVAGQTTAVTSQALNVEQAGCNEVVISRIYTRGGGSAEGYDYDFVELHNRTHAPIDVSSWTLLTAFTGAWVPTALSGSIPADGFYFIALGRNPDFDTANGLDLPDDEDAINPAVNIESYSTMIALVNNGTVPETGVCPTGIVDMFGSAGQACNEGNGFNGGPDSTSMLQRAGSCTDTDVNSADFSAVAVAAPRSTNDPGVACTDCD